MVEEKTKKIKGIKMGIKVGNETSQVLNIVKPNNKKSVRELIQQTKSEYLGREVQPLTPTISKRVKKFVLPTTQEEMAVAIALDMSGKQTLPELVRIQITNQLYLAIKNMVYKMSNQYSLTCQEDTDDLAQACMHRIVRKLWTFNPKVAKFTTWSWYVCRGVLSRKYRNGQKTRSVIVDAGYLIDEDGNSIIDNIPDKSMDGAQMHERPEMLNMEIRDAIRELANLYPHHKKLIFAMFGNPDDLPYVVRTSFKLKEASLESGMGHHQAKQFYKNFIQPFFVKHFGG